MILQVETLTMKPSESDFTNRKAGEFVEVIANPLFMNDISGLYVILTLYRIPKK